jgi:hypothetical protein
MGKRMACFSEASVLPTQPITRYPLTAYYVGRQKSVAPKPHSFSGWGNPAKDVAVVRVS